MSSVKADNIYDYVAQNAGLIASYIEGLASYGMQSGSGIVRPVYSPEWLAAHRQLEKWINEAGLSVRADAIGNLWGRLEGSEGGPVIASGSHLDTVKGGGKYDGGLGIIAALSAIRFLKDFYGPPRRTLEVVALCEEEGSRFNNTFLGSRAIIGTLPLDEVNNSRDPEGISVLEAARACGFRPEELTTVRRHDLGTFLELHIEQGRLLDDAGLQVGIVEAITGLQHLKVVFEGRADHAGTTPMDLRADSLVAAADVAIKTHHLAAALGRPAVATVGSLQVEPGARNIVPARVEITIDFRHSVEATRQLMAQQIRQICRDTGVSQGVTVQIEQHTDRLPAQMSPEVIELLQSCADQLGVSNMRMISGAGHDSQIMVERVPTAMLFVPSQAGRSHSAAEFTPLEQIIPGVAVLAQAMYKLAY